MVAPVVKPTPQSAGRPSSSRTHPAAISSNRDAAGDMIAKAPFWSQAAASQPAARAAGRVPPVTKPK